MNLREASASRSDARREDVQTLRADPELLNRCLTRELGMVVSAVVLRLTTTRRSSLRVAWRTDCLASLTQIVKCFGEKKPAAAAT